MSDKNKETLRSPPTRTKKGFLAVGRIEQPSGNLSTITITHEFEDNSKWVMNNICDMFIVLVSGEAEIHFGDKSPYVTRLSVKKERYAFVPKLIPYMWMIKKGREIKFHVFSTPPWTQEQHIACS